MSEPDHITIRDLRTLVVQQPPNPLPNVDIQRIYNDQIRRGVRSRDTPLFVTFDGTPLQSMEDVASLPDGDYTIWLYNGIPGHESMRRIQVSSHNSIIRRIRRNHRVHERLERATAENEAIAEEERRRLQDPRPPRVPPIPPVQRNRPPPRPVLSAIEREQNAIRRNQALANELRGLETEAREIVNRIQRFVRSGEPIPERMSHIGIPRPVERTVPPAEVPINTPTYRPIESSDSVYTEPDHPLLERRYDSVGSFDTVDTEQEPPVLARRSDSVGSFDTVDTEPGGARKTRSRKPKRTKTRHRTRKRKNKKRSTKSRLRKSRSRKQSNKRRRKAR